MLLPFPLLITTLLCLPFVGALLVIATGRRLAGMLAISLTGIGLALSIYQAFHTLPQTQTINVAWATLSTVSFGISFQADTLTAVMLIVVHFIALLVQIYSLSYLHDEPKLSRYFSSLQLFVGAMLGIVLAGNLLVLYIFWELVGLASYLLIGFYAERLAANRAAKKAFLMNRVGDAGFLLGIFLTYYQFDTLELTTLVANEQGIVPLTILGICLFMGCVGKSAQFPLLSWLPDAMEGPTPVSALLHAATMVAAGIFLLARIHPLLSPDALVVVTLVGTITTIWGGYSAVFQTDIKKVLAFSTVSQLGLMVAGMGTGNVAGAMFHLLTHAFFKAGLFLSAGAVIHAVNTQDMRQMGNLRKSLPTTFVAYTVCAAALSGLPFFAGFLSKEAILGGAFQWASAQRNGFLSVIPITLLLSSALTAFYMARQLKLVFFGQYRNELAPLSQAHEPDWLMRGPVVLLAGLSIWVWFSLNPFSTHSSWAYHLFQPVEEAHFMWLAPVSIVLVLVGGWLGFQLPEPTANQRYVRLSVNYGFIDTWYQYFIILPTQKLASLLNRTDQRGIDRVVNGAGISTVVLAHLTYGLDRLGVDGFVNGIAWLIGQLGRFTRSIQNGRVQSYITAAVVGLLLMLWWLL
ncbi:NADH-quinone oxidoreductase subunit 5 family protein [Spirosoma daeguense]